MAQNEHIIIESPIAIKENEVVPYTLTVPATWGTVSAVAITAYDEAAAAVASAISGTPSVASNVISFTVDALTALTAGNDYRFEFTMTVAGGTVLAEGEWNCKR